MHTLSSLLRRLGSSSAPGGHIPPARTVPGGHIPPAHTVPGGHIPPAYTVPGGVSPQLVESRWGVSLLALTVSCSEHREHGTCGRELVNVLAPAGVGGDAGGLACDAALSVLLDEEVVERLALAVDHGVAHGVESLGHLFLVAGIRAGGAARGSGSQSVGIIVPDPLP